MKVLLWFEDALANSYKIQLWYSKIYCSQETIILQSHDKMEAYIPLKHVQYWMRILRENLKRKEIKRWSSEVV